MTSILKDYVINEETLYLMPYNDKSSKHPYTLVMETKRYYLVSRVPKGIIERSYRHYELNYRQMQKVSRKVFKKKRKLPYLISAKKHLVMFPTCGTRKVFGCCYIAMTHVRKLTGDHQETTIHFHTGQTLKISQSVSKIKVLREKSFAVLGFYLANK